MGGKGPPRGSFRGTLPNTTCLVGGLCDAAHTWGAEGWPSAPGRGQSIFSSDFFLLTRGPWRVPT